MSARRERHVRTALTAGLVALLATGAVVAATTTSSASGTGLTATFTRSSDWGTGFTASYAVTNPTSSAVSGWTLEFDLPTTTTVTSLWNGKLTRDGTHLTVVNEDWNGTVAPGATVTVGLEGTYTGTRADPTGCLVNDAPCTGADPTATATGTSTPTTTTTATVTPTATTSPTGTASPTATTPSDGTKVVGYFTEWGVYGRNYHVKDVETSGAADELTHIVYAFGNVTGGKCAIGDAYADYQKAYTAATSVDGVADSTSDESAVRGNFGQLRRLKKLHPDLEVVWSFGGWTWSSGFTEAAKDPQAFAASCHDLVEDPRWADVFDGIDIDWEYPNACGLTCDSSGTGAYRDLMAALRSEFGGDALVTSAITADGSSGGKLEQADYAGAAQYVDWYMPMTYDYFGAFDADGPTAPHSPLTSYQGIPTEGFTADAAVQKLTGMGVPASKLLLGVGFYGRGWTGVTQEAPGGAATGAAPGTYEAGIEDYEVLATTCPATRTVAGTAYALCGTNWWSYDTPATLLTKMDYAQEHGLGGAFFWELSGDTADGDLVHAIGEGLGS